MSGRDEQIQKSGSTPEAQK